MPYCQHSDATKLQGFFAAGVNYSGGNDLKGDYGKVIGSSLKFKITGSVKAGTTQVGILNKSLYGPIPYQAPQQTQE